MFTNHSYILKIFSYKFSPSSESYMHMKNRVMDRLIIGLVRLKNENTFACLWNEKKLKVFAFMRG